MTERIPIKSLDEMKDFLKDIDNIKSINCLNELIFNTLKTGPASLSYIAQNIIPVSKITIKDSLQKLMEQNYVERYMDCPNRYYFGLTKDGQKFWENYEKSHKKIILVYTENNKTINFIFGGTCGDDYICPAKR
jgi:DNA-binding HxlR family transcriptional regulator